MTPDAIRKKILEYGEKGLSLFLTSSFQTHSIPLLHLISRTDPAIPVYFLNTGYLFPETIIFRDRITEQLGINTIDLRSQVPKSQQKDSSGNLLFTSDPDRCCYLNKTQPLEPVLAKMDVWISGVRADQNANRRNLHTEEKAPNGILRFHPILDWTAKDIYYYRKEYDLPSHPLEEKGYFSIGCEPCTRKLDLNDERSGRWSGLNKTECGLHTDLIEKDQNE